MNIESTKLPWQKKSNYGHRNQSNAFYQSKTWKQTVAFIWARDKGMCQLCLSKGILHPLTRGTKDINKQGTVDHKVQRIKGGTDNEDNLWLIGTNHHYSKSANEGNSK